MYLMLTKSETFWSQFIFLVYLGETQKDGMGETHKFPALTTRCLLCQESFNLVGETGSLVQGMVCDYPQSDLFIAC